MTQFKNKKNSPSDVTVERHGCYKEAAKHAQLIYSNAVDKLDNLAKTLSREILDRLTSGGGLISPDKISKSLKDVLQNIIKDAANCRYPIVLVMPYYQKLTLANLRRSKKMIDKRDVSMAHRVTEISRRSTFFYGSTFTRLKEQSYFDEVSKELFCLQYGVDLEDDFHDRNHNPVENFEAAVLSVKESDEFVWVKKYRVPANLYVGESNSIIPFSYAIDGERLTEIMEAEIKRKYNGPNDEDSDSWNSWKVFIRKMIIEAFAHPELTEINDNVVDGDRYMKIGIDAGHSIQPSYFHESVKVDLSTQPSITLRDLGSDSDESISRQINKIIEGLVPDFVTSTESITGALKGEFERLQGLSLARVQALTLYDALRTDYSLARLEHYTYTHPKDFQPHVILTNYLLYVRAFVAKFIVNVWNGAGALVITGKDVTGEKNELGIKLTDKESIRNYFSENLGLKKSSKNLEDIEKLLEQGEETEAVTRLIKIFEEKPGAIVSNGQMPAYHYKGKDCNFNKDPKDRNLENCSVSLVNIGVGPANARTITDSLAVLRPRSWMMLGHCAGLRTTQSIGDYVLPAGYFRKDNVLDREVPTNIALPYVETVNRCLEKSAEEVLSEYYKTEVSHGDPKDKNYMEEVQDYVRSRLRSGVCMSTQNRHWELDPYSEVRKDIEISRAIAVDMESATIAANGYRHRVPYGALLCISDNPLKGEQKMRDGSQEFYKKSSGQHFLIGLGAIKRMYKAENSREIYMTRRLRGFEDPLFR